LKHHGPLLPHAGERRVDAAQRVGELVDARVTVGRVLLHAAPHDLVERRRQRGRAVSPGRSTIFSASVGTGACRCCLRTCTALLPAKGSSPVSIEKSTTPSE